jgi:hypothetical protein
MYWVRVRVHPMMALCAMVCSDRWAEPSPQLAQQGRQQVSPGQRQRQLGRRQCKVLAPLTPLPTRLSWLLPLSSDEELLAAPLRFPSPPPAACKGCNVPYRPPPAHLWRRVCTSLQRAQPAKTVGSAKLCRTPLSLGPLPAPATSGRLLSVP